MATAATLPPSNTPLPTFPTHLPTNTNPLPQSRLSHLLPTPLMTPLPEMRARLHRDGYLYLKHLLPRPDVLSMRAHYFSHFTSTGLLSPTHAPGLGIYNSTSDPASHRGIGGGDPSGTELAILEELHRDETYRAFVAHPQLREMVRRLMGWEEEVLLTRTMLRHNVPGGAATGVHFDKQFLRGGEAWFLTAWVPIGDVGVQGGGLMYLEGSVGLGEEIEGAFGQKAEREGLGVEERRSAFNRHMSRDGMLGEGPEEFERECVGMGVGVGTRMGERRWLVADYEAGDVVLHHPSMVHGSARNEDPEGRIRLSTDLRFYDKKDFDEGRADARWMKFWTSGDDL